MPSADQHRRKAENNRKFLSTISLDDYLDWAVVAAFYTAVHRVEQLRAEYDDGDSVDHEDRLSYVQEKHPKIHTSYHILQNASMLARYQSNSSFYAQFQKDSVAAQLIDVHLVRIEEYLQSVLQRPI